MSIKLLNNMVNRISLFSKKYIKYIILTIAVVACAFGIIRGEMADVLQKAVNVCLECCGIG